MAEKFKNKYRIPSVRANFWDYRWNAAYFVTICTQNKEHFFGEINDSEMRLSEIGEIALDCWIQIPEHFSNVTLGNHIIMPNHMHGIVVIENPHVTNDPIDPNAPVETLHATSPPHATSQTSQPIPPSPLIPSTPSSSPIPKNEKMAFISPKMGSLAAIIRSYKSAVSRLARRIHADFAWQTRFHDHIIRHENSFNKISDYIANNPSSWVADTFYNSKP